MRRFDIRIERPDGSYHDLAVGAETVDGARSAAEKQTEHDFYEWRGLVAFVDGALPAEESPNALRRNVPPVSRKQNAPERAFCKSRLTFNLRRASGRD